MSDNPVFHPLAPPTLSGNEVTVDLMLKEPTRVTRMLMDLTQHKFILDRVFASAGGVSGGAVLYDKQTENELFTDRDVERIAPGGEFPLVTGHRTTPNVASVEKWGGKFFMTDEAIDRNEQARFVNHTRQLANTLVRKLNQRAIEEIEAAIPLTNTFVGNDWTAVVTNGVATSTAQEWPGRDFAHVIRKAEEQELGVMVDTWLVNPQEYESLAIIYGDNLQAMLNSYGIKEVFSSNRVTAGTAYACGYQQVGEMKMEQPLATKTWYEEQTERTFVQSGARPVMYIPNPYSIFKITGLG